MGSSGGYAEGAGARDHRHATRSALHVFFSHGEELAGQGLAMYWRSELGSSEPGSRLKGYERRRATLFLYREGFEPGKKDMKHILEQQPGPPACILSMGERRGGGKARAERIAGAGCSRRCEEARRRRIETPSSPWGLVDADLWQPRGSLMDVVDGREA